MKSLLAVFLAGALLLAGCFPAATGKPKPARLDIPGPVLNLDPQFATEPAAKMILSNVFEGLVTRGENGALEPGAAESWEVSGDGKTLTFRLRQDAFWKSGEPVTAADFVFAFRRLFRAGAASPHAGDYLAIQNAGAVLAETKSAESLGVSAKASGELVIRLEHPSPFFPDLLAEPPAMPCNEGFFIDSRGRYGIDVDFVDANGPLYVERWDNESAILLRPNGSYASPGPLEAGGVTLRVTGEDTLARLQDGAADLAFLPYEAAEKLEPDYAVSTFEATVWCIVFNQSSRVWGNPLLRQGLSLAVDREMLRPSLPQKLVLTDLFLPPAATLAGKSCRGDLTTAPAGFAPEQARYLYELGRETLPNGELTDATLYAPDSAEHLLAAGMVQQSWQKYLNAFLTTAPQSVEQLESRFASGGYGLMLMPFTLESPRAELLLGRFETGSGANGFGYHNTLYDLRLEALTGAKSLDEALAACAQAETILLQDAVIVPLYCESSLFAASPDTVGASPAPCLSRLNFRNLYT